MPKLYTKTGDKGETSLYTGQRLPKTSKHFEALGDLDELNCHVGLARAFWREENGNQVYSAPGAGAVHYRDKPDVTTGRYYEWYALDETLTQIQQNIMMLSSCVATPGSKMFIDASIEQEIDRLSAITPPIRNFVVPSGHKLCAQLHVCRAITRRCERKVLSMELTCVYLNRLSDYFFALTRFVSMTLDIEETLFCQSKVNVKTD